MSSNARQWYIQALFNGILYKLKQKDVESYFTLTVLSFYKYGKIILMCQWFTKCQLNVFTEVPASILSTAVTQKSESFKLLLSQHSYCKLLSKLCFINRSNYSSSAAKLHRRKMGEMVETRNAFITRTSILKISFPSSLNS